MQNKFCVPVSLLWLAFNVNCVPTVTRQTANGPVEGIVLTSSLHKKYHAFKGVPYAEPPITGKDPYTGKEVDRRFKAPEPLKRRWSENLIANEFKYSCISSTHFMHQATATNEDCLFLNIYVPAGGAEKKTVLVWIHGGGFAGGDATDFMYGPDFLLSEDNIVVIMQYRLGIFGFLNLGFGEYTGNMGLKDQQMALRWIHENIEYFYGNKDEILLMGESAGSICVNFHMMNEESRKYFNRAYLGSGSAFNYWALSNTNHVKRMQEYSKIDDEEKLIEYLKTSDSETFDDCHRWDDFGNILISPWAPTIESPDTVGAFMTKTPEEVYNSEGAPTIDAVFAFNTHEYTAFIPELASSSEPLLKENWEESKLRLPFDDFNEVTHPEEYKQALESLRKAYFPDPTNSEVVKYGNMDLLSEISFGYGILKAVTLQTRANAAANKNTFLFRFSMESDLNTVKLITHIDFDGACHGEDLCYYFHCRVLDGFRKYKKHLKQKDAIYNSIIRMVKIITNFARTGNPSIENDTPFKSCESPTEIFCQEISNSPKSSVTTDIMEQLHYDTWHEIEETYKRISQNH